MGSPESFDSSRKRMSISQTCSLLSQFLKGNGGGFGEQPSLGLTQNLEHKGTMNLLPMIEKSGQNLAPRNANSPLNTFHHLSINDVSGGGQETVKKSDISCGTKFGVESAPLTIFYADQVIVFNDFPADKANEIMMLADKSAAQNLNFSASAPPITTPSPTGSPTSFPNVVPSLERAHRTPPPPPPQFVSDLPIARKNSLARFLEKRKDRSIAAEPYPARKPTAAQNNNEAWLRLGPQLPSQFRRN